MAHFVLVHGASHGGWCWRHIVPLLEGMGHRVLAIDLPGHGEGEAPMPQVTLSEYKAAVLAAIEEGTILVGHSLAGLTITLAAAQRPQAMGALVYVAAFVPPSGVRLTDFRHDAVNSAMDEVTHREGMLSIPDPETSGALFYSDCSAEDRAYASARLSPQPISVMTEVLDFDAPNVVRHYVLCTKDKVVMPAYQRAVTKGWPTGTVHEMDTGHSPFFSQPQAFADILDRIAQKI